MNDIVPTQADEMAASDARAARQSELPSDYMFITLDMVCEWFDEFAYRLGKDGAWFRNACVDAFGATHNPYDADYFFVEAGRGKDLGKNLMPFQITGIIACCVEVRAAEAMGDERLAWTYAADARQLAVIMMQYWSDAFRGPEFMARRGALARLVKNPVQAAKHAAMKHIREEFERWQAHSVQYENDAAFAKTMHAKHAKVLKNEGSIKNACTRWRKAQKSSS